LSGLNAVDAKFHQRLACGEHRAVNVDAAAGVFEYHDIESLALCVLG
jgi:hypothetical protein